MRPDEHKKKQRADYKKKHGISSKKASSKEGKEKSKDDGTAQDQAVVLSDVDQDDQVQFSRRTVHSNWDKYEEIEESSEEEDIMSSIQQRGEDYNVLLQRSANPASEFRFQSEKDWDKEIDSSTTQDTISALKVDFVALAASLNSVPLHKRLNISPGHLHLPPDLVNEFEERAKQYRTDPSCLHWTVTNASDSNTSGKLELRPHLVSAPETGQNDKKVKRSQDQLGSNAKQLMNSQESDKDPVKVTPVGSVEPSKVKPHNVEDIKTSLKEVSNAATAASTNSTNGKVLVNPEKEDELEFLLSLETPGINEDKILVTGNTPQVKPSSEFPSSASVNACNHSQSHGDDDLEDWLDSVLG